MKRCPHHYVLTENRAKFTCVLCQKVKLRRLSRRVRAARAVR